MASLPARRPILAVGADLKNTIALVVDGRVILSQHTGDLDHLQAYESFRKTIDDLRTMYAIGWDGLRVVHDQHPHYRSAAYALSLPAASHVAIQHHRAHIASVLAERGEFDSRVVGVAFDGTGYGDDGTIWGGEFFVGSIAEGFERLASIRPFALAGGDAAARSPIQAAAGFLSDTGDVADLTRPPFLMPPRYSEARKLAQHGFRTFTTTSAGRLFDCAAALLGFTRPIEHEGQAAMWLEYLARQSPLCEALPFAIEATHLDFRPAIRTVIEQRVAGRDVAALARAFHEAIAEGIAAMATRLCDSCGVDTVVLSGGTFQNALLVERVRVNIAPSVRLWTNRAVPPNDGGVSLGQAAVAAMRY